MKHLPKPTLQATAVLLDCAATISDPNLQRRVRRQCSRVAAAEQEYRKRGRTATLYRIAGTNHVGSVPGTEMVWLYDKKLSRRQDAARVNYDAIRAAAPNSICPFCSGQQVKTLDHYLAKTTHPTYAVTPLNLVPACFSCNHAKLAHTPASAGEQIFHPYFDRADGATWLTASVVRGTPPGLTYSLRLPSIWTKTKRLRLKKHFELLQLASIYASQAGSLLSALKYSFQDEHRTGGAAGLRRFLKRQATFTRRANRNGWLGAMYAALANSDWFCTIGHRRLVAG